MTNKKFSDELLQRIAEVAQVEEIVAPLVPLKTKGSDLVGVCPKCQKKDKLSVNKAKQVVKCFSCGDKGFNQKTAINLVMHVKGCTFPDAVMHLVDQYNLHHLLPEFAELKATEVKPAPKPTTKNNPTKPKQPKAAAVRKKPKVSGSFRDQTIAESGITEAMQRLTIVDEVRKQKVEVADFNRYESGSLVPKKGWAVEKTNVNMIMHYIGLDLKRMTYIPEKGGKTPKPMVRCRFENPEANAYNGKVAKYISPKGSGLHLWLPNKLIKDFNAKGSTSSILTIQEGEKKADRFCEVAPSVGIMGIHSLAKIDDPLPPEFHQLQKKFEFKTYIFFMDADLFELSKNKDGSVDQRPRGFATAAKRYRHHINKFRAEGEHINILLAHPTTLAQDLKGTDDLMESGLVTNAEMQTILENGVKGIQHDLVKFYDLTQRSDDKIDEIWHVNKHVTFADKYREKIQALYGEEKFKLGRHYRKYDSRGVLEFAQPMLPAEEFYTWWEDEDHKKPPKVFFSDTKLMAFLANRGFFRYREVAAKNEETTFNYIRVEDNTVVKIPAFDIRDFVLEFLDDEEDKKVYIRDHFRRNHENLLGQKTFSLLPWKEPTVLKDTRDTKFMTFKTAETNNVSVWTITKDEVKPKSLAGTETVVWRSSLIDAAPNYIGPLFHIKPITPERIAALKKDDPYREIYADNPKRYTIEITPEGRKTVFLQFLENASNFSWRVYEEAFTKKLAELKKQDITATDEQLAPMAHDYLRENSPYTPSQDFETQQHLIAKLTAIGHLTRKYKDPSCDQWIYAMEGNLIEDDKSEGRSGKSLIPDILKEVYSVAVVDGTKDLDKDIYAWDKVTAQTDFINIDDARKGRVNLTRFYSRQKGDFGVRAMNRGEFLIPYKDAPVGYLSSNFNLMPNDGSTRDRWRTIVFSDRYSDERKPNEIHEHLFWTDWDDEEKGRFFSLLADCNRANYQCGGVMQGPSAMVEKRRWEQEIGKVFMQWANSTFLVPSVNDNVPERTGVEIKKFVALGTENENGDNKPEPWSFYGRNPEQRQWVKETAFKKKLWLWCLLKGYIINPGKTKHLKSMKEYHGLPYGGDHKPGGVECFSIWEHGQEPKADPTNELPPF